MQQGLPQQHHATKHRTGIGTDFGKVPWDKDRDRRAGFNARLRYLCDSWEPSHYTHPSRVLGARMRIRA